MDKITKQKLVPGIEKVKDHFGIYGYQISKPYMTPPVVIGEYHNAEGVRMYQCEDDRHFIADKYDATFVPAHKKLITKKIKPIAAKKKAAKPRNAKR